RMTPPTSAEGRRFGAPANRKVKRCHVSWSFAVSTPVLPTGCSRRAALQQQFGRGVTPHVTESPNCWDALPRGFGAFFGEVVLVHHLDELVEADARLPAEAVAGL